MPALSPTSTAPLFTAIQQVPTDESSRHTPSAMDSMRKALAKHVDALQKAALPPLALKNLGALILDKEDNPCARCLAVLLHPPVEPGVDVAREHRADLPLSYAEKPGSSSLSTQRPCGSTHIGQTCDAELARVREAGRKRRMEAASMLWEQHVPHVRPPRSLIEFAGNHLGARSGKHVSDFFLPFKQLAERGIWIPDDIALVFTGGILPFDTFQRMVETYVVRLPIPTPEEPDSPAARDEWNDSLYWEHALAALCSRLSTALLDSGESMPEMLTDWIGLKKREEALGFDQATRSDNSPAPSEFSTPIAGLLATWSSSAWPSLTDAEFDRYCTSKAAYLKNPEKLRALADNLVPRMHIAYLLSLAGSLDSHVLEREMDRVAEQYKGLNANIPAKERAFFYIKFRPTSVRERERLKESWRNMNPYLTVHTLCADKRLETWAVAKAFDDGRHSLARLERRPARALFDAWTSRGISVECQIEMGRFMAQGFDETWAANVVKAHADDRSRVQAWFARAADTDLEVRLNSAMKTAVARWLADNSLNLHTLSLLPAMIQSDMSVEQIDRMLCARTLASLQRINEAFFFDTGTPDKIRYGLITPEQLLDQVLHGSGFDNALIQAELRNVSELRRKAAETRDHLRFVLHAVEILYADMEADTPQAAQCEYLANALKAANAGLDDVLQPRTDARRAQDCQEIHDKLSTLVADLNARAARLAAPAGVGTAEIRLFA